MMKRLFAIALALLLAVAMVACSPAPASSGTSAAGGSTEPVEPGASYTIGYCINNFNDTFQTYIFDEVQAYADASGGKLTVISADAQEDTIRQQDEVNSLIAQGVDALIVVPVDTSAMEPITKAAADAGIPLCYVNRNPYGGAEDEIPEGVYYVGSQEILAGQMQMEYIGELLGGKGGVAILQGILSNEGAVKRTEGNELVIAEQYPDIEVLAKEAGDWQRDQGMTITENWISAFGDGLNAILANNDEMALGAVRALEAAGRTDVLVIGIDGIPDAIEAIEAGQMAGSVLQDAAGQGQGAIKVIEQVLDGGSPEAVTWVDFKLITPENVEEFK